MFPEVGSTIVPPGFSFPSRSAASIIVIAIRSLIEPPGLRNSSLARTVAAPSGTTFWSRTSGVLPTSSSSVGYSRAIAVKRNRYIAAGAASASPTGASVPRSSTNPATAPASAIPTSAQKASW